MKKYKYNYPELFNFGLISGLATIGYFAFFGVLGLPQNINIVLTIAMGLFTPYYLILVRNYGELSYYKRFTRSSTNPINYQTTDEYLKDKKR